MKARSKEIGPNYLEVDISLEDMENIKRGRYPSKQIKIAGEIFLVSVGLER